MATTAHNILARLAFTVTLFTAGHALAAEGDQMALVLHVDNYARIPPAQLARAEAVVTAIYKDAGIQVTWINDEANLALPLDEGARHLRVLLLCPKMTGAKATSEQVAENVLGQAGPGGTRAYIFTYRVRNIALKHAQPFHAMLGHVMAHEIGHLLLPPHSHSDTGIMREQLNPWKLQADTFTLAQSEELRLALNR